MATRVPNTDPPDKALLQTLARHLRAEFSPTVILYHLKALGSLLHGSDESIALFLKAGGFSILIHHLRGTATAEGPPDKGPTSCAISDAAAQSLMELLQSREAERWLVFTEGDLPPLIDAFGNAPSLVARSVAATAMLALIEALPEEDCDDIVDAMIDARVVSEMIVHYYNLYTVTGTPAKGYVDGDVEFTDFLGPEQPGAQLMRRLIYEGRGAANQLAVTMVLPHTAFNFLTLLVIQDCLVPGGDNILPALQEADVLDAIVTSLRHESPFVAAAAAGALAWVARNEGGVAMLEACGAIPALVPLLNRRSPDTIEVGVAAEEPLYRKATFGIPVLGKLELHFNDPAAVAFGALFNAEAYRAPLRDAFIQGGGVPALVQILRESICPLISLVAVVFFSSLMSDKGPEGARNTGRELADLCFESGFSQAILHALMSEPRELCGNLFSMVSKFFRDLSPRHQDEAMAVLVSGGAMEEAVDYMFETGSVLHAAVVDMLLMSLNYPQAKERLCAPEVVQKLMNGTATWLEKEDGPLLFQLPRLLNALLAHCPAFMPAAVNANLAPGLVRIMHKVPPDQRGRNMDFVELNLVNFPMACLTQLAENGDIENAESFWKPAIEDGIVPVIIAVLTLVRETPTVQTALRLSALLMLAAPSDELQVWAGGLPRAISELIAATPPVEPLSAMELLFDVGLERRGLISDFHTWGVTPCLKKITKDRKPTMAAAAKRLLFIVDQGLDDSPADLRRRLVAARLIPADYSPVSYHAKPAASPSDRTVTCYHVTDNAGAVVQEFEAAATAAAAAAAAAAYSSHSKQLKPSNGNLESSRAAISVSSDQEQKPAAPDAPSAPGKHNPSCVGTSVAGDREQNSAAPDPDAATQTTPGACNSSNGGTSVAGDQEQKSAAPDPNAPSTPDARDSSRAGTSVVAFDEKRNSAAPGTDTPSTPGARNSSRAGTSVVACSPEQKSAAPDPETPMTPPPPRGHVGRGARSRAELCRPGPRPRHTIDVGGA